ADRLHPDAENVTLPREEGDALRMEARSMRPVLADVEEVPGRGALRPVRTDQHPGMLRNATVPALPVLDDGLSEQEIRIPGHLPRHVDHAGGADEAVDRNVVGGVIRM